MIGRQNFAVRKGRHRELMKKFAKEGDGDFNKNFVAMGKAVTVR